ncbi:hypothetical protein WR25_05539 [Diploscapter pachys]|uniref:Uncharacterized protein n=1 Tax=Diploscapter pachys TaxID=2018661 RepID=A0A2A2K2M3_9BILA|nr:hypothetical protein WR25_05539 [Diploscapter pachys]
MRGQIVGDRHGAAFRQLLVVRFRAGRIGEAVHVDEGLVVLRQRVGNLIERALELRLHRGAVVAEGDARRDVEDQIVAFARDLHVGAGGAGAQIAFLLVHVRADAGPREAADAGAQDLGGTIVAAADEVAEQIAAERAADAADRGRRDAALAGFRIGGAGAGRNERRERSGGEEFGAHDVPLLTIGLRLGGITQVRSGLFRLRSERWMSRGPMRGLRTFRGHGAIRRLSRPDLYGKDTSRRWHRFRPFPGSTSSSSSRSSR